jgi:hypothetical protein
MGVLSPTANALLTPDHQEKLKVLLGNLTQMLAVIEPAVESSGM